MPIHVLNRGIFNPYDPASVAQPSVAGVAGAAYDADVRITVNQPVSGTAEVSVAAYDATIGSNTLPAGMTSQVFVDEFTGSTLHPRWAINTDSTWGATGNRIQKFRTANVSISAATSGGSGNSLKLASKREGADFTAGMIETRPTGTFFPLYGMYEARMKIPHMQGIWPAFWLRQRASASICEIDIMEYFHAEQPAKGRMTLHRTSNNGTTFTSNVNKVAPFFEAPTTTPGWHTFTVSILPDGANTRIKGWCDDPGGTGAPDWNYLDTQSDYWADAQGTARADYAFGEEYWDITIQGSQIGGSWLCHPDDPKGYSRWLDSCVSGGTKPNACNTTVGGYPIWTDAANWGGTGLLGAGQIYEIDYVKVWSAM